jgi:hypothetical protein
MKETTMQITAPMPPATTLPLPAPVTPDPTEPMGTAPLPSAVDRAAAGQYGTDARTVAEAAIAVHRLGSELGTFDWTAQFTREQWDTAKSYEDPGFVARFILNDTGGRLSQVHADAIAALRSAHTPDATAAADALHAADANVVRLGAELLQMTRDYPEVAVERRQAFQTRVLQALGTAQDAAVRGVNTLLLGRSC